MHTSIRRVLILVTSLLGCAGCGTGFYSHEIDLTLEPEAGEARVPTLKAGIKDSIHREDTAAIQLHGADSNGVIHIPYSATSSSWVWQQRPAYLAFDIFVPRLSTNGYFHISCDEASKAPWRGLKRGPVKVKASYVEFETWYKGKRTLPALRADVAPLPSGGYQMKIGFPVRILHDGLTAPFVPYQSYAEKN